MAELLPSDTEMLNYKAFVMQGDDMSPAVNQGDFVVVDLAQRFIRSGDIYVIEYQKSIIVCRLLLDREQVKIIFDGSKAELNVPLSAITIVGRAIEIKTSST